MTNLYSQIIRDNARALNDELTMLATLLEYDFDVEEIRTLKGAFQRCASLVRGYLALAKEMDAAQ
jgi:hypothetical protein